MKRIAFIMLGLFAIFSINSCEKDSPEEGDDCKAYYHYTFNLTVEILALKGGQPMANEYYQVNHNIYRCGIDPILSIDSGHLDENGYRKIPLTYTYHLQNNHDYVNINVLVDGKWIRRTIDYRDFNGVNFRDIEIEAVFNF